MPRGDDKDAAHPIDRSGAGVDTIRDDAPRGVLRAVSDRVVAATISDAPVATESGPATRSSSPLFGTTMIGLPPPPLEGAKTEVVTTEPAQRVDVHDESDLPDLPDLMVAYDPDDVSTTREIRPTSEDPTPLVVDDGRLTDPTRSLPASRAQSSPRATIRGPVAPIDMAENFVLPYDGEAMTVRVRSLSPDHDEPVPLKRARPAAVESSPIVFVAPEDQERATERRSSTRANVTWVLLAFLMGGVAAYALHLWGPALRRPSAPRSPDPAAGRGSDGLPGASNVPPEWASGAVRVWTGSLTGDGTNVSYVLVLRGGESGHVAGHFSWTVGRLPGARAGEQVRESVEGTYESTLGALDLRGTLSTNPVVIPVNVYRLHVRAGWGLVGETLDAAGHIAGTPSSGSTN